MGERCLFVCLFRDVGDEETIHYVDFTSLYPFTNKYSEMPTHHPEILSSKALINRSPLNSLVLSSATFFRHRSCFIQCFRTVRKESWCSLYGEGENLQ